MIKSLREKIIEILEKIDDIHTDGYLMKNYQEKLADQILELFEAEKQKWERENKKPTKVEWYKGKSAKNLNQRLKK